MVAGAILSFPATVRAGITYVNDNTVAATGGTQSSVTGMLTGVTAGNLLVAIVTTDSNGTITKPSGWIDPGLRADSGTRVSVALYYYPNYPTTGTVSATFSFSAANGSGIVQLVQLAGAMTSNPLDITATAFGQDSPASITATNATTVSGDIAIVGWANSSGSRTFGNPTSPWILVNNDVQSTTTDEEGTYQTDIAIGTTLSETLTVQGNNTRWAIVMATFKAAPLYWRGGLTGCASGSTFTSTSCWSRSSGGPSAGVAPGTADLVTFDSGGTGNCALSSTAATQVRSLATTTGYTGTITQGSQNVTISGDMAVVGGTFNGASGRTITVADSLAVGGGTFNGNGATVSVGGLFLSGGTYTQGSGSFTDSGAARFSGGAATFGSGQVNLNGGLDVEGATVTFGSSASTTTVTGTVTIGSGTVNLANGSAATDFTCDDVFTMSGGAFNVNGATATLGTGITGSGNDAVVLDGGTFTNTTAGGSVAIGTTGGGGGALNVSGASAVYNSSRTETFNGPIRLTGTLSVGSATLTGSSNNRKAVTISSGATMNLSSSGFAFSSANAMTIAGTLNAGTGTASFAGDVTVSGTVNGSTGTQAFADAVTVSSGGLLKTGAGSMTGTTAASRLVTISSGGTMTLASSGFIFNSTNTMTIAGTLNAGSGAANTITFAGAVTLSGTFNANSGSPIFNGTVSLSSTGVFNGNTGTTTFNAAESATALADGTFNVGDAGSTGRVIFSQGASFASGVILAFPTSGGTLSAPGGQTLTINATVTSSAGSASTPPKIARSSGTTGVTIAFGASTVFNVDGLEFDNSVSGGVSIASGVTYTALKHLTFKNNVANSTTSGATHLALTSNNPGGTKVITIPGCYFDATAQYNVTMSGVSGSTGARAIFELQSTSTNGARAGEAFDLDADTTGDNVADTTTASRYGAVCEWVAASPTDTSGTAVGFPTAAFDWNTFAWYGIYVSYKNTGGGTTSDVLWKRNNDGSAGYSFTVPTTSSDLVGTPKWDTINEVTADLDVNGDGDKADTDLHVVYIATAGNTTSGILPHVIKLIDTGSAFVQPTSGAWATDFSSSSVKTITSPLVADSNNLYFGGTDSTNATKVFGVQISKGAGEKTLARTIGSVSAITAAPAYRIFSGTTYLYLGSTATASQAYIYRTQVTSTIPDSIFSSGLTTSVNDSIRLINDRAYAVTDNGKMFFLQGSSFLTGGFTNHPGSPYTSAAGSPMKAAPYVDPFTFNAYVGDNAGNIYVVTSLGANLSPYPFNISGVQFQSSPVYLQAGGVIAIGGSDGYVYFINRHNMLNNPVVFKKFSATASGTVSTVAYNSGTSQYMVSTSDGKLLFINRSDVTDPDSVE